MNDEERFLYNEGERLLPGISHNEDEARRHIASYTFFKEMIDADQKSAPGLTTIVDLGCGVGYGCRILSKVPHSAVFGIDCSPECIEYARKNYREDNTVYQVSDLKTFIPEMAQVDYAVSRGVFEHIEDGLALAAKVNFKRLFMFDVPYNEKPGNPHHKILGVTEEAFNGFSNVEFYYEDIKGNITSSKQEKPNMIMCVCKKF